MDIQNIFSDVNSRKGGNAELRGSSVNQDDMGSDCSLNDGQIGPSRSELNKKNINAHQGM